MKTKRILSIAIIIGFIITMFVIQIDRKIHERNMYESEIKGILWKIIFKKGGPHYYYNDNKSEYFIDNDFFQDRSRKNIVVGDSIYKPSHSKEIYIYIKVNNKYKFSCWKQVIFQITWFNMNKI